MNEKDKFRLFGSSSVFSKKFDMSEPDEDPDQLDPALDEVDEDEEEEGKNGDGGNKKKPDPKFNKNNESFKPNPEEDENSDEETDSQGKNKSFTERLKHRNKTTKRNFSTAASLNPVFEAEMSSTMDAMRSLMDEVNARDRKPFVVDNGTVPAYTNLLMPLCAVTFGILNKIQTKVSSEEATGETISTLRSIAIGIADVQQAVSHADAVAQMMSMRNLYASLMAARKMIHGEANLVNGPANGSQEDLWGLFSIYDEAFAEIEDPATHNTVNYYTYNVNHNFPCLTHDRSGVGDNAMMPDLTLIKPIFMLFPCLDLKRKLAALDISPLIIGATDNDQDFGILGCFGIPTCYQGLGGNGGHVREELRDFNGLRLMNVANETLAINEPRFTWSNQGNDCIRSSAPLNYVKQNDRFVAEVEELTLKCRATNLNEIDQNMAFFMIMTQWLNGAFKAIVEANAIGTFVEFDQGIKINAANFIGVNNDDVSFNTLASLPISLCDSEFGDAQSIYESIISLINQKISGTLGGKIPYSETTYNEVKQAFKTMTYVIPNGLKMNIGDIELGEASSKIIVAPKLYLPVDVTSCGYIDAQGNTQNFALEIDSPRVRGANKPVVDNPWLFALQSNNTRYVSRRHSAENDILMNISIFHAISNMTGDQYDYIINGFYSTEYINVRNQSMRLLDVLRPQVGQAQIANAHRFMPHSRFFSAIAPFYNKTKILGLAPVAVNEAHNAGTNSLKYPIFDQMHRFPSYANRATNALGNQNFTPFGKGEYIAAFFNQHGDWSWIEAGIVAACMMTRFISDICTGNAVTANGSTTNHHGTLTFWWDQAQAVDAGVNQTTTISTYFRRNRNFMDDPQYKLGWVRFNQSLVDDSNYPSESSRISKQDIIRAFRWRRYQFDPTNTHIYLVDTFNPENFGSKKYWIQSTAGDYTNVYRLITGDEPVNIMSEEAVSEILSEGYLDGSLLIYDAHNNNPLSYTPAVIPGTTLVGYEMTVADADRVVGHIIGNARGCARSYQRLDLNDYCYIKDDFYVTTIFYSNSLVTNTVQAQYVVNAEDTSVPNTIAADILLNILHAFGMDGGNARGVHNLMGVALGINYEADIHTLVRDFDTVQGNVGNANDWYVTEYGARDYVANRLLFAANSPVGQSYQSSWRYPSFITVPSVGRINGIPEFNANGTVLDDLNVVSFDKARSFYSKLGTILSNGAIYTQTEVDTAGLSKYRFYELRRQLNAGPGAGVNDLVVNLPVKSIINALGMEVK